MSARLGTTGPQEWSGSAARGGRWSSSIVIPPLMKRPNASEA